jgi:DNA replication protein DnaC
VLFLRAGRMFTRLHQSRADHSTEKAFRRLLAPDLLILDDFGLRRLSAEQSSDLYEVILERHRRASTIVTSNRSIDERALPQAAAPRRGRPSRAEAASPNKGVA